MNQLAKPKKLKLSDYEVLQTLGTGMWIFINLISIKIIIEYKKLYNIYINIYKYKKTIGSFGRVRLSKNKVTGKYWALKSLKKAEIIRLK